MSATAIIEAELARIDEQIRLLQIKRHYWSDAMEVGGGIADLIRNPINLDDLPTPSSGADS